MKDAPPFELDGMLDAGDFNAGVSLFMEDGTVFSTPYGFARREGDWWCVYTEHSGYHAFPARSVSHMTGDVKRANRDNEEST